MDLLVFPIPIPPPISLSTRSLWVFPVHQLRALVSCIQPGLVICFTLDNIHVLMLFSRNIPPSPSPKSVLFLYAVSWLVTMVPFLHMDKQAAVRRSPSQVGRSATVTEASSQGHCHTFSSNYKRYEAFSSFYAWYIQQEFTVGGKFYHSKHPIAINIVMKRSFLYIVYASFIV